MSALCTLFPLAAAAAGSGEFRPACLKAGGSEAVCACKANAAVKLLDARMLDLVVMSMNEPNKFAAMSRKGGLSHSDNQTWTAYIRDSNHACGLSY